MKKPLALKCLSRLFLAATLLPPDASAFTSNRAGESIASVPVAIVSAQQLDRSMTDTLALLKSLPQTPLSPARLAKLKQQTAFSGLTDAAVNNYMGGLNRLTIDSIETISRIEVITAESLLSIYGNARLHLAFGGTGLLDYELRQDGSTRVGDEAVNIYWFPNPASGVTDFKIHEPDGFKYLNILADVGLGSRLGGYVGPPPNTVNLEAQWALANQTVALGIATDRLDRLNDTVTVLDGVVNNLMVPAGVDGFSARVGRSILREAGWSDTQKRDAARELRGYIYGCMLTETQQEFEYRGLYQQSLQLYLAGSLPSTGSYNDHIKRAGNWHLDLMPTMGEFKWISVVGGGGSIANPTSTPVFTGKGSFWQISARLDGTKLEEQFSVPGADYLSSAYRWDDKLVVGAINIGSQMTTFYGYLDQDGDGRVEDGTRRTLFTSGLFTGGFDLRWNNSFNEIGLFDRGTRNLYGLTGTDIDGLPIAATDRGGFDGARKDLLSVGYSSNGKWATAYPDLNHLLATYYRTSEALLNETTGKFESLRVSYRYDEIAQTAAAAEVPWPGSLALRATYTPDATLDAYKLDAGNWVQFGTGKSDPLGRVMIGFDQPLQAGQQVRLGHDPEEASPPYVVPEVAAGPTLYDLKLYRGDNAKVGLFGEPETQVELRYSTDLDQWDYLADGLTSMFGGFSTKADFQSTYGFVRAIAQPKLTIANTDHVVAAPGQEVDVHPGWNDRYALGMIFALSGTIPPELVTFFAASGSARLRAHTSGSATIAYRIQQNAVFIQASQMVVYPEYRKLFFPPILLDDQLNAYVQIRCLVIGGENYPMYQFNLARPDDFCVDTHWHKPPPGRVYHLNGDATGTLDPNFNGCGFGSFLRVPQTVVIMPLIVYRLFIGLHPPTLSLQ